MTGHILWNGQKVGFRSGENLASALSRAGVIDLGRAATGQTRALFCGIGQCQNCLVRHGGRLTEACLLICQEGLIAASDGGGPHG
ncbi:MAG: 2Fe-2S iron-sulfur cluster-binding protein [Paracoccaceae bacterium]|nr:2Fe-2S iron-sulfur cluster-binding protein [Paracoccaceae bacterium]